MKSALQALSRATHNLISTRPPKTNRLLMLFLLSIISATSFVLFQVFSTGLKNDLRDQHLKSVAFQAETLAQQVHYFLDVHINLAKKQTRLPLIQQSIMQPETGRMVLADWFNEPGFFGYAYPQMLTDFNGMMIAERDVPDLPGLNIAQRFRSLLEGRSEQNVGLIQDRQGVYFLQLAVPVVYGQAPEGLLIIWIPLDELREQLNLEQLVDLEIQLSYSGASPIAWGKSSEPSWINLPSYSGLHLHYRPNMSNFTAAFTQAEQRLALTTILIALFAALASAALGRWFFVLPLERLQAFAAQLSRGSHSELNKTKRLTVEIQALSDQIVDMGQRIRRREMKLIERNEELKRKQKSLVLAEKMAGLGQVTAGVAHEINNPIGFIMNNLCTLHEYHFFLRKLIEELMQWQALTELPDTQEAKQLQEHLKQTLELEDLAFVLKDMQTLVEESISGADRIKDITQGLKGYAHSGDTESAVDLNDCITSTLNMVRNELKYHCEVNTDLNPLPALQCVGGQINQVLMNLIINAGHAMEGKQGMLNISSRHHDDKICITIEDNGCGIPADKLDRIFDPFYTTKPVGQGTGLGMSISYDIIKKYGGDITVTSKVDVGTRFDITFPTEAA